MDFSFDEEQRALRETARAFLDEHSSSERVREAMASELGFDPGLWKQIGAELGWTALAIPEEYGGLGLSTVDLVALLEVMGEALLCAPYFSTVCLGANALIVAGTDDQKQEWLPAIAEGQAIATLAVPEASGRWEASGVEALARPDGGDFVLSGAKRFVPDGHCADLIVVAARAEGTSGADGIGLFAVPADAPGLARRALPTMDQTRRSADVTLNDVRVPASAALSDPTGAVGALSTVLDRAAIGLAAEQVGGAQRCLDLAVAHARERVQFGRPIGTFQAVKHRCADMLLAVECARSAAYYAGCAAAEGGDVAVDASLAKATASEAFFQCASRALQIHGGVGFTWEYDVHLYFKRAQSGEALLGDPAWHRERVAQRIGL